MAARPASIGFKILLLLLVPLISLGAVWGFAASVTVGQGLDLLKANTLMRTIAHPSENLGAQLQRERLLSVAFLSVVGVSGHAELDAQRARTDQLLRDFRARAFSEDAKGVTAPAMESRLKELNARLDQLPAIRDKVDIRGFDRLATITQYSSILDAMFRLYDKLVLAPDVTIYGQSKVLNSLGLANETIARESALITGGSTSGSLTAFERAVFNDMVANRRFIYGQALPALDDDLAGPYQALIASPTYRQFEDVENQLVASARTTGNLPPEASGWRFSAETLSGAVSKLQGEESQRLVARAEPIARAILIRIGIAGGLGLIVVVATLLFSVRLGRRLARELVGLRNAAHDLANARLPDIVERLRRGEDVDIESEAPPLSAAQTAEVNGVVEAFSSVQRTAVAAAVSQAELRKGVSQVFRNLARRSQSLLHRQLALLDTMERKADQPETLDDLFRLDHLTTRMRRHAEGLIILSGATPGRGWRRPVRIVDVVRGAVAEVEDYTRVTVHMTSRAAMAGSAVADVIHLIAELVENGAVFSPPYTEVQIRGEMVGNGFAIEVEDRGLGMSAEQLAEVNERLAHPPEFDLADSTRLGLFVVARLAARHQIGVSLRASPYGGVTAIVLLPRELVVEESELATIAPSPRDSVLPGRHRTARAPEAVAEPAPDPAAEVTDPGTSTGLPRRVRRANLAPQLRQDATAEPEGVEPVEPAETPPPERFRSIAAGFHEGARRGRAEAEGEA